jgi:hypothetical protein
VFGLVALVAASLVGSAQALYCTYDSQCEYTPCNDQPCPDTMLPEHRGFYCANGIAKVFCSKACHQNTLCPDPPACPAGQCFIGNGKNGGGDYACRSVPCAAGTYGPVESTSYEAVTCTSCPAGKFQASAGSSNCTDCGASKFSAVVGATAVGTCSDCNAGKYAASAASAV